MDFVPQASICNERSRPTFRIDYLQQQIDLYRTAGVTTLAKLSRCTDAKIKYLTCVTICRCHDSGSYVTSLDERFVSVGIDSIDNVQL